MFSAASKLLADMARIATSRAEARRLFGVPLYSGASYLTLASAVNSLAGFVFWVIVARLYSTEEVGLASAALAAAALLASLAHLGLGMGLIRYLGASPGGRSALVNSVFTIGVFTSLLAAAIFIGGVGLWSPALAFMRDDPGYLAAFILITIGATLTIHMNEALVARRRAGFVLARNTAFSAAKLVLPLALVGAGSLGVFASWGITTWVSLCLGFFLLLPRSEAGYRPFPALRGKAVREMLGFSFASYLSELFWGLSGTVLPIVVLGRLGPESSAYFYIAWATAGVLSLVPTAVAMSLFAEGSLDPDKLEALARRSLKMAFVLLVPLVAIICLAADRLLLAFGSAYSEGGSLLLRVMAVATLPLTVNLIYLGMKRVRKRLGAVIGVPAFVALVSLGLGYLLTARWGIAGGGVAWLIGQTAVALAVGASWLREKRVD